MTETRHLNIVPTAPGNCPDLPLGSPAKFAWGPDDVAAALDICVRALLNVRKSDPTFPTPRLLGTTPRWSPAAIHNWLFTAPSAAEALNDAVAQAEAAASTGSHKAAARKPAAKKAPKSAAERRRHAANGRQPHTGPAGTAARASSGGTSAARALTAVSEMWHV